MAKERARKRAEREAATAREREVRARRRARRERLDRAKGRVSALVPDAPRLAPGLLARRRRRRLVAFAVVIVLIQVLVWPLLPSWPARLVLLGLSLLAAPIAWVLAFGRV
ncbi:MAG: hypothetical protein ACR2KE_02530 [Candidatus Nanopelagicales bacterium]